MSNKTVTFRSTTDSAMIQGCRFVNGVYQTHDPDRMASLRGCRMFNRSVFELTAKGKDTHAKIEDEPDPDTEEIPDTKPDEETEEDTPVFVKPHKPIDHRKK